MRPDRTGRVIADREARGDRLPDTADVSPEYSRLGVAFGEAGTIGHETPDIAVEVAGVDQVHPPSPSRSIGETADKPLAPPPAAVELTLTDQSRQQVATVDGDNVQQCFPATLS